MITNLRLKGDNPNLSGVTVGGEDIDALRGAPLAERGEPAALLKPRVDHSLATARIHQIGTHRGDARIVGVDRRHRRAAILQDQCLGARYASRDGADSAGQRAERSGAANRSPDSDTARDRPCLQRSRPCWSGSTRRRRRRCDRRLSAGGRRRGSRTKTWTANETVTSGAPGRAEHDPPTALTLERDDSQTTVPADSGELEVPLELGQRSLAIGDAQQQAAPQHRSAGRRRGGRQRRERAAAVLAMPAAAPNACRSVVKGRASDTGLAADLDSGPKRASGCHARDQRRRNDRARRGPDVACAGASVEVRPIFDPCEQRAHPGLAEGSAAAEDEYVRGPHLFPG